jgi:hypothetical protein
VSRHGGAWLPVILNVIGSGGMSVQDHFPSFYRQVKLLIRIIATAIKGRAFRRRRVGLCLEDAFNRWHLAKG